MHGLALLLLLQLNAAEQTALQLLQQGQPLQAEQSLVRAAELGPPDERARLLRTAARWALHRGAQALGRPLLERAYRAAPQSFHGRMARVDLATLELALGHDRAAALALEPLERDGDPLVSAAAAPRLRAVRERRAHLHKQLVSGALVLSGLLALPLRALRTRWTAACRRALSRAWMAGWALALVAGVAVPRLVNPFAVVGYALWAPVFSLGTAVAWASRGESTRVAPRAALALALLAVCVAGQWLAWDLSWWSRPDADALTAHGAALPF